MAVIAGSVKTLGSWELSAWIEIFCFSEVMNSDRYCSSLAYVVELDRI